MENDFKNVFDKAFADNGLTLGEADPPSAGR